MTLTSIFRLKNNLKNPGKIIHQFWKITTIKKLFIVRHTVKPSLKIPVIVMHHHQKKNVEVFEPAAEEEDGEKLELELIWNKWTKIWIGGRGSIEMKLGNYETVLKLCSYQSWLVIL